MLRGMAEDDHIRRVDAAGGAGKPHAWADDEVGVGPEDLGGLYRERMRTCLEAARQLADPSQDWDRFVEVAWGEVGLAFGLVEREGWPAELPLPWWAHERRNVVRLDELWREHLDDPSG